MIVIPYSVPKYYLLIYLMIYGVVSFIYLLFDWCPVSVLLEL